MGNINTVIIVVTLVLVIIYAIVLGVTYNRKTFIFTPYVPPNPPSNMSSVVTNVVPLANDELTARRAILAPYVLNDNDNNNNNSSSNRNISSNNSSNRNISSNNSSNRNNNSNNHNH